MNEIQPTAASSNNAQSGSQLTPAGNAALARITYAGVVFGGSSVPGHAAPCWTKSELSAYGKQIGDEVSKLPENERPAFVQRLADGDSRVAQLLRSNPANMRETGDGFSNFQKSMHDLFAQYGATSNHKPGGVRPEPHSYQESKDLIATINAGQPVQPKAPITSPLNSLKRS